MDLLKNRCRFLATLLFIGWSSAVSAQLSAAFNTASSRAGCSPLVVNFTDASTGNPTYWKWDLGNGVTSLRPNPSTTYINPGTYTVKLVVRNAAGNADSVTKTEYITVNPAPTAGFTADKTTGCFPLPVSFTDGSIANSGTITGWVWDFGDGNTSTQKNPLHTYTGAGDFTVTLRVTNSSGCSKVVTKPQYINVASGVTASFTNTDPGACAAPSVVAFTNTSTGPGPLTYTWTFGDGGTSTLLHPTHTYTANGSYTVMLAVASPQGCTDTVRKPALVNIGNAHATFAVPDSVCTGTTVAFMNTSTPAPVGSNWNFGNGATSTQQNPSVTYATPGTYTIKLTTDFGGCSDSANKRIVVSAKPQPAFDATVKTFCSAPATVSFTNQSTGNGSVVWDFGDSTISTANNPTHTYLTGGTYTVSLTVTNAAGCSDTLIKKAFIQVEKPRVLLTGLPRSGCAPITVTPTATVTSSHTIGSYKWVFGDGTTSTAATPTHTYNGTGTYTVTLVYTTITGCTDSVVMTDAVKVGIKPHAAFTLNPTTVCAFQPITFTDNSTGTVDQWFWTFGDGGTSSQPNPVYQYSDTGYFHVQLIVFNNTCPDTVQIKNAVYIKPPVANFVVQGDCERRYTKTFSDRSIGATSWYWNFGDGTTSTQQNPVHTYTGKGAYQVTLWVSNGTCQHSTYMTIMVVDEKAAFTGDSVACRNATVSFGATNINAAYIALWQWNFGDGTTSTAASLTDHVYKTAGTYNARLIITDVLGCSDTISHPVKVYGPTANFSVSSGVACFYQNSTTFTDASTGDGTHPVIKRQWTYGDGTADSSGVAPYVHSYAATGNYTISLLVKDGFGCTDVLSKPAGVVIVQPKAGFRSPDTLNCTGKPTSFINTSTGDNLQSLWAFGEGLSSSAASPAYTYTSIGTYTVKLVVTDRYGCKDSLAKPAYINISYPKARFTVSDSFSTCPPLLVHFAHQSSDYTSLRWDFGDGTSSTLDSPSHFYTAAGTFTATLTAKGPGGCTDMATKQIIVKGPSGSFSYAPLSGCKPLKVNFTGTAKNIATYTWDFADGNIAVVTDPIISHTYINAGDFLPKLILTDAGGCSVPIFGLDTIKVIGVTAGFALNASTFCNDGTVQFTNTTVGNDLITSYAWTFGDGSSSAAQYPSHYYSVPGLYPVSLKVASQSGCLDSLMNVDTVKVYPNPVVFISHNLPGCVPLPSQLYGNVAAGNATTMKWLWDLGNGQTDTQQNPSPQVYTVADTYNITALATDEQGCKDTASVVVNAYPIPAVNAGPDVFVCRGSFAQLAATGAATYIWNTSPSLSCVTCASPLAAPTDSTQYVVTGTSAFGCVAMDSVTVSVHQPFTLGVGPGDTVCAGSTVHLRATGADQYTWTPSTAVANPTAGLTTAAPMITTAYKVIARDNYNCFTDTGLVYIKVWPYPTVDAGADQTVSIGTMLRLTPKYSNDIISYQWTNPMQTLSCTTCPSPTVQTKVVQNTYGIRVVNEGGCVAKDEVTIYAICNGGNLFIPNSFSPNGDGKNDVFYPRGSGIRKIKSLRVYNRWGEVVFTVENVDANDASMGWNGAYKGAPLPPDVYVYTCEIVCMNNEVLLYNGNVTLLK